MAITARGGTSVRAPPIISITVSSLIAKACASAGRCWVCVSVGTYVAARLPVWPPASARNSIALVTCIADSTVSAGNISNLTRRSPEGGVSSISSVLATSRSRGTAQISTIECENPRGASGPDDELIGRATYSVCSKPDVAARAASAAGAIIAVAVIPATTTATSFHPYIYRRRDAHGRRPGRLARIEIRRDCGRVGRKSENKD